MATPQSFVIAAVAAYLLGAIPMGYLVGRTLAGTDVREQGSGKTGATNVRRVLGWRGFFLVYLLDVLKGMTAVIVGGWIADGSDAWVEALAGLFAVIGHNWPVFLGFKGGRGVATGTGATLAMVPGAVLASLLIGVPLIYFSRYVSLGSVAGAIVIPTVAFLGAALFDTPWPYFYFTFIAGAVVLFNHKDNIERLRAGTERRI